MFIFLRSGQLTINVVINLEQSLGLRFARSTHEAYQRDRWLASDFQTHRFRNDKAVKLRVLMESGTLRLNPLTYARVAWVLSHCQVDGCPHPTRIAPRAWDDWRSRIPWHLGKGDEIDDSCVEYSTCLKIAILANLISGGSDHIDSEPSVVGHFGVPKCSLSTT